MDAACTRLVLDNLDLVDHVVAHHVRRLPGHVERDELVACGRIGLIEAAERFDATEGVPFRQYARLRVDGAVIDSLRAGDWTPTRVRATLRQVNNCESTLSTQLHRPPTEDELARCAGISRMALRLARQRSAEGQLASIDSTRTDGGAMSTRLVDLRATSIEDQLEATMRLEDLRAAISRLPERHRVAVVATFLEGRPGNEVAQLLGVSPSRVSQLRAEALQMLLSSLNPDDAPTPTEAVAPVGSMGTHRTGAARSDWSAAAS